MRNFHRKGLSQLTAMALGLGLAGRVVDKAEPEPDSEPPTPEEFERARLRSEDKIAKAEAKRQRRSEKLSRQKWSPCMNDAS